MPTEVQVVAEPRPINLTSAEIAELTPEQNKRRLAEMERQMYGHDAKRDRNGNYVEQGIGSKGNETMNHFRAMREAEKMGDEEPGTVDRKIAELIARDPKRARAIGLLPAAPAAE